MPNQGVLGAIVWPPYLGVANCFPGLPGTVAEGEPFDDINYERAMIAWRTENGNVLGAAQIYVPKGIWTHLVFFSGPHHAHPLMGANQLEQPIIFDRPGIVEINPIVNQNYLPR
jgi:hypothetical protein